MRLALALILRDKWRRFFGINTVLSAPKFISFLVLGFVLFEWGASYRSLAENIALVGISGIVVAFATTAQVQKATIIDFLCSIGMSKVVFLTSVLFSEYLSFRFALAGCFFAGFASKAQSGVEIFALASLILAIPMITSTIQIEQRFSNKQRKSILVYIAWATIAVGWAVLFVFEKVESSSREFLNFSLLIYGFGAFYLLLILFLRSYTNGSRSLGAGAFSRDYSKRRRPDTNPFAARDEATRWRYATFIEPVIALLICVPVFSFIGFSNLAAAAVVIILFIPMANALSREGVAIWQVITAATHPINDFVKRWRKPAIVAVGSAFIATFLVQFQPNAPDPVNSIAFAVCTWVVAIPSSTLVSQFSSATDGRTPYAFRDRSDFFKLLITQLGYLLLVVAPVLALRGMLDNTPDIFEYILSLAFLALWTAVISLLSVRRYRVHSQRLLLSQLKGV